MKIQILAVGKIKEKYHTQAIDEYVKRLSPYCSLKITEISAAKILSEQETDVEKYKKEEAEKILSNIKSETFVIALEIKSHQLSSEAFAQKIAEAEKDGVSEIAFVIGGANGLHKSILERADFLMSFSPMTFTHQMARIILLEQLYRSFKILKNEPYHR